jgi:hypothetical protein
MITYLSTEQLLISRRGRLGINLILQNGQDFKTDTLRIFFNTRYQDIEDKMGENMVSHSNVLVSHRETKHTEDLLRCSSGCFRD